jgi:hypothetical protein
MPHSISNSPRRLLLQGGEYGSLLTISDTGVVSSGTDSTSGQSVSVTRTGATGGTINSYGVSSYVSADNAGAGTSTAYGVYSSASGADSSIGVYSLATSSITAITDITGVSGNTIDISSSANTSYGIRSVVQDFGGVGAGTDTTYGSHISVTRSGASGGTINNYGQYITLTGDTGGTSTIPASMLL